MSLDLSPTRCLKDWAYFHANNRVGQMCPEQFLSTLKPCVLGRVRFQQGPFFQGKELTFLLSRRRAPIFIVLNLSYSSPKSGNEKYPSRHFADVAYRHIAFHYSLLLKTWYLFFSRSQTVIGEMSSSTLDCCFSPLHKGLVLYYCATLRILV